MACCIEQRLGFFAVAGRFVWWACNRSDRRLLSAPGISLWGIVKNHNISPRRQARKAKQNAVLNRSLIGGSALRASYLALGPGELSDFAVSLGCVPTAAPKQKFLENLFLDSPDGLRRSAFIDLPDGWRRSALIARLTLLGISGLRFGSVGSGR